MGYVEGRFKIFSGNPEIKVETEKCRAEHLAAKERFITSDNPLHIQTLCIIRTAPYDVGLAHPNIEATFPITQELALFAGWKDCGNVYRGATDATVRVVNLRTILNVERFVYASFHDEGFASEYGSIRMTHERANFNRFALRPARISF